jgi:hypothetical protein
MVTLMKKNFAFLTLSFFLTACLTSNVVQNKHLTGRWMTSFNTGQGFNVFYIIFNNSGEVTYSARVYSRSRSNHYEQIVATGNFKLDGEKLIIEKELINEPGNILIETYTIFEITENELKLKSSTGFVFNYKKTLQP